MGMLNIERIGGLAGFGMAGSAIKSDGQIAFTALSPADQKLVEALFKSRGKAEASQMRDGFRYRISRGSQTGADVIEVPETSMPAALIACVKDRLG